MTDMQLMTLVVTLLAIFASSYYNRKSQEDIRDVLRAEFREQLKTETLPINNKLDHLIEVVAKHSAKLGDE